MLSAAAAERFLRKRYGQDVSDLTPIGHGEWSRAYAFRSGADELIVRFSALDEDFHKDRIAARFASSSLPIPEIVAMGALDGGYYAIARRARGGYLDDLDGAGMRATLPALLAALDAMREVDCVATTGYGTWGADGEAPPASWRAALLAIADDQPGDRTHGWRERLADSPTGNGPFAAGLERLRALVEVCPEARHLIHGDLLNYNVLVADGRISAVIDWGCAMYGDFLYDLAWLVFWAPWYPAWDGIDFEAEAAAHYAAIGLEVPNFAKRLRCYQIHIGLDSQAYNAFRERWDRLADAAARTREVAGISSG
jgi:hygromycin-B 4-O-kinase